MTLLKNLTRIVAATALVGAVIVGPTTLPALADASIGAGVVLPNQDGDSLGGIVSLPLSGIPAVPVSPQVTGLITTNGEYAVTAEARVHVSRAYLGAGYGISRLQRVNAQSGGTFSFFAGTPIAPLTTLELRYYAGTGNRNGSAAFLGLAIHI